MKKEEVFEMLSVILDVEIDELDESKDLEEYEEWDSLARLTLMAEVKKRNGHRIAQEHLKTFKTVGDICEYLKGV